MKLHLNGGFLLLLIASVVATSVSGEAGESARAVNEIVHARDSGDVVVDNAAGSVCVEGWARNFVSVVGDFGGDAERVDVRSEDHRTSVRMVPPSGMAVPRSAWANLKILVPMASNLRVSVASADVRIQSVYGQIDIRSANGHVTLSNKDRPAGKLAGQVEILTVDGGGRLELGAMDRFHLSTVSGRFEISATLGRSEQFSVDSVSGEEWISVHPTAGVSVDVRSLGGGISDCAAPSSAVPVGPPGSRFKLESGDGGARVLATSLNGNFYLCLI